MSKDDPEKLANWPLEIYLLRHDDCFDDGCGPYDHGSCVDDGALWCEDSQNNHDIKYVRSDVHETLARRCERMREALERVLANECPLTGNPSHADLVSYWEGEKREGRGEADDMLFALAALKEEA